jgi:methylthioribose-1-phosphate isomerase
MPERDDPLPELRPVWFAEGRLHLLDQRALPGAEQWLELTRWNDVAEAIATMAVRGAPAIGCAAAYGLALAAREAPAEAAAFGAAVAEAAATLEAVRPTAVNLVWAVSRVQAAIQAALGGASAGEAPVAAARRVALAVAEAITAADLEACHRIGAHGLALVPEGARVLTHCNAGALATAGYGTALGVVRAAAAAGRLRRVYADETRPRQQGARLTAWELQRDGIPVTVVADTVAGYLMARGEIDLVVVGADRIARNGDTANKIGTYGVAVLAAYHRVPFYVAAPVSTLDLTLPDGQAIPIEERSGDEVAVIDGQRVVPVGVPCLNPAFDVTPASLISGIITEHGVARPPYESSLAALHADGSRG